MTYVVTENCIKCKYMDCVEVCPVDCFYVGENMLMIHPDECIDCGVCEPECPAEAIVPDSDDRATAWAERNRIFSLEWPNITRKGEPPADADDWKDKPGKEALFSPAVRRARPERDDGVCTARRSSRLSVTTAGGASPDVGGVM